MKDTILDEVQDLFWEHPQHKEYMKECSACYADAHPDDPIEEDGSDWEDEVPSEEDFEEYNPNREY